MIKKTEFEDNGYIAYITKINKVIENILENEKDEITLE